MKHYAMKMYGGVDVQIHMFLTSALVGEQSCREKWTLQLTNCLTVHGIINKKE
jgi:hypothetical protein